MLDQVWQQVCVDCVVGVQSLLDQGQFKVGFQCSLVEFSFSLLAGAKQNVLQLTEFYSDSADLLPQLLFAVCVCLLSLPQQGFDFVKYR